MITRSIAACRAGVAQRSEDGGNQSIEVPGQERIQTTSPDPKIKPGKQRPNHGRFRAPVVDQGKAIDPQIYCKPVESMLDGPKYSEVQEADRNRLKFNPLMMSNPQKSHALRIDELIAG